MGDGFHRSSSGRVSEEQTEEWRGREMLGVRRAADDRVSTWLRDVRYGHNLTAESWPLGQG